MKKILPVLLVLIVLFSGCTQQDNTNKNDKLSLVATIFPQYDFLREITKNVDVDLKMIIAPGMEVHGFESTLTDISAVTESDLLVYVGSEDDEWIKDIPAGDTKRVALSDIIEVKEDYHFWTSPKNSIMIVQSLSDTLCEIDPENAETYKENTAIYIDELKKLDEGFESTVANGKRNTVVFAERFPFRCLAEDYGLEYFSAFEGCSTETEAGIKEINSLVEETKKDNIPVVFTIEFSESVVADNICKETGARKLLMHSCQNVTEKEFADGETYLSLMNKNLDNLKIALG